jgi:hypothetical protein
MLWVVFFPIIDMWLDGYIQVIYGVCLLPVILIKAGNCF